MYGPRYCDVIIFNPDTTTCVSPSSRSVCSPAAATCASSLKSENGRFVRVVVRSGRRQSGRYGEHTYETSSKSVMVLRVIARTKRRTSGWSSKASEAELKGVEVCRD